MTEKTKAKSNGHNEDFTTENIAVAALTPHPRNYRDHPEDQLEHIIASIEQNGIYRNIIIAKDNTILAGHGVVKACEVMGIETVPVKRLDIDPHSPRAIQVLTGDNEIANLGLIDDRELSELLRDVRETDYGLLGTGYDDNMLSALVYHTRPKEEVNDFDAAQEWVGMPEFEEEDPPMKLVVRFRNRADRDKFVELIGLDLTPDAVSAWWPYRKPDDLKSVKFLVPDDE